MSGRNQFDLTPEERSILERRAQIRQLNREQYLKLVHNPHKTSGGYMLDAGIERFMALNAKAVEYFKPSIKSGLISFAVTVVPVFGYAYLIKSERNHKEHLIRTGQLSYRDRTGKLV
ncbi:NADH dehydrogenase [ubiquinone] 1 beta subcomplex subunit 4 [Orussus abietinus]|uniref:NADH dehydrogenase [ubiquinone] 1 beta subcomplex subunit 4 n=1 Tax=Orussus abietinus TaxID=222816 RepID=UPI000626BC05|nr:NADH dehydrogenase [ubiquinone] 1 beta subcomplex subunit 4 [Orussus abietinus]